MYKLYGSARNTPYPSACCSRNNQLQSFVYECRGCLQKGKKGGLASLGSDQKRPRG